MEDLKQILLQCEVYVQEENWDRLMQALQGISEEHLMSLGLENAKDCLSILNHLISLAETKRLNIAENLVNLKKFREGYNP
ncbi:MAG: hypothetical protein D6674_07230 [Acidobacteria bacterium]|jgi:hypothetical protein|nr:MAG: hypothetical protein D6674_07230 [Acidobacteriota bacterium]